MLILINAIFTKGLVQSAPHYFYYIQPTNRAHLKKAQGISIHISIHILVYADDVIFYSKSPPDCGTNKIGVNLEKTEIMKFRKGDRLSKTNTFQYKHKEVAIVNYHTYLTNNSNLPPYKEKKNTDDKNDKHNEKSSLIVDRLHRGTCTKRSYSPA